MPNYFETLRLPIQRGRGFGDADRAGSPLVVVVSQSMARRVWPGLDPIGKRIRWAGDEDADRWRTVVGVVADTRYRDFLDPRPSVYVPAKQQPWEPGYLLVRTSLPLPEVIPALRQVAREVHPDLALVNVSPDGCGAGRPTRQTPVQCRCARLLLRPRGAAHRVRPLRPHRVRGGPAETGGRHSAGARGAIPPDRRIVPAPGHASGAPGGGRGCRHRTARRADHVLPGVRRCHL